MSVTGPYDVVVVGPDARAPPRHAPRRPSG